MLGFGLGVHFWLLLVAFASCDLSLCIEMHGIGIYY